MNAVAILQPISARVLQRPVYRNQHLSDVKAWFVDNAAALDGFWCALSRIHGAPDVDYITWLAMQHDVEVIRSEASMCTCHGHDRIGEYCIDFCGKERL